MLPKSKAGPLGTCVDDSESLRARLTACVCQFSQHLATQRSGCLAQVWVPGVKDDGSITMHTQVRDSPVDVLLSLLEIQLRRTFECFALASLRFCYSSDVFSALFTTHSTVLSCF